MSLTIQRIPLGGTGLSHAYQNRHGQVAKFYLTGSPTDIESYAAVAEVVRTQPESRWTALRDAPTPSDAVRNRLNRLIEARGLFVSTGQQAGLFVSPLFTLYKALTAARLARTLEERLDVPVMPLFSIASEDHDWEEVNHTHVIDLENRLTRLSLRAPQYEGPDSSSPPVERITLGPEVDQALGQLAEVTPDTEFKAAVLDPIRDAYRPGRPFATAFQETLTHLLREHDFVLARSGHPYVKGQTRELLWREWEKRDEVVASLADRSQALEKSGFESQVPVAQGTTNLFLDGALGRDRVLWEGSRARLRRSGEDLHEDQLRSILESEPFRISPGALLRPVAEARAFPVVAHVAGPSEIAYLAQSHALFQLHDVPAPVVVPRNSFRLIESKVEKVLQKYDLEPEALSGDASTAINRVIDEQTPEAMRDALASLRRSLGEGLAKVERVALEFDPGARSAIGSGKKAVFQGVEALEAKLQARVRQEHEIMRQQLEKAAVHLYPDGRPQERVLNPFPYLVRYGESLLAEIYSSVVTPLD